jgi:diadenylate cyclase
VTVFVGPARHQLDPIFSVFAKANQGLAALETYRRRLDQVLTRLTALEFQGAAVLDDVLVVVQRGEMTHRMVREVERDIVELGSEGRLIQARLDELSSQLPEELAALVADYHTSDVPAEAAAALDRLALLAHESLLETETLAEALGYPRGVNPLDTAVSPRGYRALSHVPRLPPLVIKRLVHELDGLEALARASLRELEGVEGVGAVRAREIKEGLRRLQEHNLVERYLNI